MSVYTCQEACEKYDGCVDALFHKESKVCYMFDTSATPIDNVDFIIIRKSPVDEPGKVSL